MERIDHAVSRLWEQLKAGRKIDIPRWQVERPEDRPDLFSAPPGAWPAGQTCDHVMRFNDGSRVHVQCMRASGQDVLRFHRDKYDPAHSFENFVLHGLTETPIGPVLGALALLFVASSLEG